MALATERQILKKVEIKVSYAIKGPENCILPQVDSDFKLRRKIKKIPLVFIENSAS